MTALPTMADALAAGDGCLHARIDALEAQVAVLRNALNGFIANSCRVDWPADIYDAAIAAQKDTV